MYLIVSREDSVTAPSTERMTSPSSRRAVPRGASAACTWAGVGVGVGIGIGVGLGIGQGLGIGIGLRVGG